MAWHGRFLWLCFLHFRCRHAVIVAVDAMGQRDLRMWPDWYQDADRQLQEGAGESCFPCSASSQGLRKPVFQTEKVPRRRAAAASRRLWVWLSQPGSPLAAITWPNVACNDPAAA